MIFQLYELITNVVARTKLHRFSIIEQHPKVIQATHPLRHHIKWRWRSDFFGTSYPLVVELACWYGEYTLGLARHYPNVNYVGVDIKGERFYHGLMQAQAEWLTNIWFVRTIIQNIEEVFAAGEVNELRVVHPDPYPKWADERRRLTHHRFLDIYHRLLSDNGILRVKTDDHELWHYCVDSIANHGWWELVDMTADLYQSDLLGDHHDITTRYERRGLQWWRTICYGVWRKII